MRAFKVILPVAALLAAIFIFYTQVFAPSGGTATVEVVPELLSDTQSDQSVKDNAKSESTQSMVASESSADARTATNDTLDSDSGLPEDTPSTELVNTAEPNPDYPETYGYEVGTTNLSDEELIAMVMRLRKDDFLFNELLNELRSETDTTRIKRLTALLGETSRADVLPVAEELAFSTSPELQRAGLDLLSRVAEENPEAYDIAINILSSSSEPDVLVSTMNVLATPRTASAETKSNAITQIMPLADHESAAVRRHSVSLLPRLTNDVALSPILYNALSDTDPKVRFAATYAYASYPFQPPEAVERLLQLAENPDEDNGVRRGAIYALQKMAPDEATNTRISQAKIKMREAALAAQ